MKVRVKRMEDPDPRFVSLVDRGASRKPFTVFKRDGDAPVDEGEQGAVAWMRSAISGQIDALKGALDTLRGGRTPARLTERSDLGRKIAAAGYGPEDLVT